MKKLILLLSLFLIHISLFSQVDSSQNLPHHTWAIKGKILPWSALVLPVWGINCTVGGEYDFAKKHALGFELVYNDEGSYQDYPSSKGGDSAGPNGTTRTYGVFLYYKKYININNTFLYKPLRKLSGGNFLPYWSLFARYGYRHDHYNIGFITNTVAYNEWQYSAGVLVGEVIDIVDVNMGFFYKQSYIADVENEQSVNVLYSHMRPSLGFRVGVNLFLVTKRKSDHCVAKYTAN